MLTSTFMSASVELNLPTLSSTPSHWVVTVPARLGRVQTYLCATHAIAQRLLAMFVRAKPPSPRRGWPFTK